MLPFLDILFLYLLEESNQGGNCQGDIFLASQSVLLFSTNSKQVVGGRSGRAEVDFAALRDSRLPQCIIY